MKDHIMLLYNKAIATATMAVQSDHAGDYTNALTLYMLTCEYMIASIKYDRNSFSRNLMKKKMAGYLTRAEKLKALLCGTASAATANGAAETKTDLTKGESLPRHFKVADGSECAGWDEVAGMTGAKEVLDEAVIFPQKHPEFFVGKRRPWKGILLYGPPGTGKSLLIKALAAEARTPIASISASDLVSKWQGDSEKALKELFVNARKAKPAIIFIDEIDSIGSARKEGEQESIRRLKTELLRQLDGVGTDNDGVTFIAATNAPWDLDSALRRRFDQVVHIPLPDQAARNRVIALNLNGPESKVTPKQIAAIAKKTKGYSSADLQILCREALMMPVRRALKATHFKKVKVVPEGETKKKTMWTPCKPGQRGAHRMDMLAMDPDSVFVGKVTNADVQEALRGIPSSVSDKEVERFKAWSAKFKGRDGAVGTGVALSSRAAASTAAAAATGTATGAGAGAGAGVTTRSAAPAMQDAPTGVIDTVLGWFGFASSTPAEAQPPPPPPPRRAVMG